MLQDTKNARILAESAQLIATARELVEDSHWLIERRRAERPARLERRIDPDANTLIRAKEQHP